MRIKHRSGTEIVINDDGWININIPPNSDEVYIKQNNDKNREAK